MAKENIYTKSDEMRTDEKEGMISGKKEGKTVNLKKSMAKKMSGSGMGYKMAEGGGKFGTEGGMKYDQAQKKTSFSSGYTQNTRK